jgi:hypothetical protein
MKITTISLTLCAAALAGCTHRSAAADPNQGTIIATSTTIDTIRPAATTTSYSNATMDTTTFTGSSRRSSSSSSSTGSAAERREVHDAIHTLERAKMALEHASHDFGGHRTSALRSVDGALHELNLAAGQERRVQTPREERLEDREIHRAVLDLERARRDMETAKHDFGGRRTETLRAVDESLRELRLAAEAEK